ncbi:MAG: D-lactate dehydrogenase [Pseudomonas sp.]|jgi:D-lactate dehydrogenase
MRIILFSCQAYDRDSFNAASLPAGAALEFQHSHLTLETVALALGCAVVCAFINDDLSAPVLQRLASGGTQLIALRSAGYTTRTLARHCPWGFAWSGCRLTRRTPLPNTQWH